MPAGIVITLGIGTPASRSSLVLTGLTVKPVAIFLGILVGVRVPGMVAEARTQLHGVDAENLTGEKVTRLAGVKTRNIYDN